MQTIFSGHSIPKARPDFLVGHRQRRLELDGYCASLNLAFEYQGEQHYRHIMFFHRNVGDFEDQVQRDELKAMLCKRVGVRLLVVPYVVKDRWTFIRALVLQWFAVADIFPPAIGT